MLTNDGVPVTIIDRDDEAEMITEGIIQAPWKLTNGVQISKFLDHGLTEPVMKVTVIRFAKSGSTSVGLSAMHFMGIESLAHSSRT